MVIVALVTISSLEYSQKITPTQAALTLLKKLEYVLTGSIAVYIVITLLMPIQR